MAPPSGRAGLIVWDVSCLQSCRDDRIGPGPMRLDSSRAMNRVCVNVTSMIQTFIGRPHIYRASGFPAPR